MLNENDSYLARLECLYALGHIQNETTRPSVLYRPSIHRWYDKFIVQYGHVKVSGKTPDEAMRNFDKMWTEQVTGNPNPI